MPQSWNNGITMAFARAFSILLAASASTAFTQVLWWYLRRRTMPLSTIDVLFSLNFSPFYLYQIEHLKLVPLMWFFGLLFPLISIATIFPPGSLVVQQLSFEQNQSMKVPTLNVDDRGDGSPSDFFRYAMFDAMIVGSYMGPNASLSSIGSRSFLEGAYLTRLSPCGINCSYDLEFFAPSIKCEDFEPNHEFIIQVTEHYSFNLSAAWNSRGEESKSAILLSYNNSANFMAISDASSGVFLLKIAYRSSNWSLKGISCVLMAATYNAHVEYRNYIQSVKVKIKDESPLNSTELVTHALFYEVLWAKPGPDGFIYSESAPPKYSMDKLFDLYHKCQLLSIRDAFVNAIKGIVYSYGNVDYMVNDTLIQQTALARYKDWDNDHLRWSNLSYSLSPSIAEELMVNTSISVFNAGTSLTSTNVTITTYKACYVFDAPWRLISAYASALGVCLFFLLLGFGAMIHNGVSAAPGGFLQILCTTTDGDGILNQISKRSCLGGGGAVPEELKELKVRFGKVAGAKGGFAAFGTEEETSVLRRRDYRS